MPGTTYRYRVHADNGIGDGGPWSNVSFKTTPIVKPGAPILLAADGTNSGDTSPVPPANPWVPDVNSITIKWRVPVETGGGTITSYQI